MKIQIEVEWALIESMADNPDSAMDHAHRVVGDAAHYLVDQLVKHRGMAHIRKINVER